MNLHQFCEEYFVSPEVMMDISAHHPIDYFIDKVSPIDRINMVDHNSALGLWEKIIARDEEDLMILHQANPLDLRRTLFFLDIQSNISICPLRREDISKHLSHAYSVMSQKDIDFHFMINYAFNINGNIDEQSWSLSLLEFKDEKKNNLKLQHFCYNHDFENKYLPILNQSFGSFIQEKNIYTVKEEAKSLINKNLPSDLIVYVMLQDALFSYLEFETINNDSFFLDSYLFSNHPANRLKDIFLKEMSNNICYAEADNDNNEQHLLAKIDKGAFYLGDNF